MEKRKKNSSGVLKNIKNTVRPCTATQKKIPRPPKNRELRNLEAELGVEKYKNILLKEEIIQNKSQIEFSSKYENKLKSLQNDYSLLQTSVERSKNLQQKQEIEIEELKAALSRFKRTQIPSF